MAKKMDVITLIQRHGDKLPKIQKLLGQKAKLQNQFETAQKNLTKVDLQLDRLVSTTSTAPKRIKKKVVKRKKKAGVGRPKGKGKVSRPKARKKEGRIASLTVGSASYLAAQVMGKKPASADDVVAALEKAGHKINPATIKYNLSHYPCFRNIRGEGYTYDGPALPELKKKIKKKAVKGTARKKTRKRTAKKRAAVKKTAPAVEASAS